jgi:succinoglycan biosynthesis protein ExoV
MVCFSSIFRRLFVVFSSPLRRGGQPIQAACALRVITVFYVSGAKQLHYYSGPKPNFGDDLNAILWPRLIPEVLAQVPDTLFIGVGTILNHDIPSRLPKVVFGSGAGYRRPPKLDASWDIYCVRGPLTAHTLKLPPRFAITDPAVLLNQFYTQPVARRHRVSFMPHHHSQTIGDWRPLCQQLGIHYIDPSAPTEDIIADIRGSGMLIAEAMHGAIVADAFRVPWVPVACYDHILRFKWQDWCQSLGMSYQPERLPAIANIPPQASWCKRLRSELKRPFVKCNLLPRRWSNTLPRPSSGPDLERAAEQLGRIADTQRGLCQSNDSVLRDACDRLQDAVLMLRQRYA